MKAELLLSALSLNPLYDHRIVFDPGRFNVSPELAYVGVTDAPGGACNNPSPPDDWPEIVADLPELAPFCKVPRGPKHEKAALSDLYSNQRLGETAVAMEHLNLAQAEMMSQVPRTAPPGWFAQGLPSPVDVFRAIVGMNPVAHAGYPYCLYGLPKREFCVTHFDSFYPLVCLRLLCLQHLAPSCQTPRDYYERFCSDPVLVMIKNEITKIGKRPRIIAVTSALSETIERLVSDNASYVDKESWGDFYSCIGIGFESDDTDRLLEPFEGQQVASNDSPAFDVTRTEAEEVFDMELLFYQIFTPVTHPLFQVYLEHGFSSCRSIFVFSDGEVWEQLYPGTTKTGRKLTSKFNTQSRARRSMSVALLLQMANTVRCAGDDALETHHPDKVSGYEKLGFPIRDYAECTGRVEFCSHVFEIGMRPIGVRIAKAAATLLYRKRLDHERLSAFIREFLHHTDLPYYLSRILAHRPRIKIF